MPNQRKIESVAELKEKMTRMQLAVVADYRGMTVAEMTDFRAKLRNNQAELVVAKNTLLRIAARETGYDALVPFLAGPTALTFVYDDVAKGAGVINDYVNASKKMTLRGGVLGKSSIAADVLGDVAKLPSREQVLAEVVGGLQSPVAGLLGVLNAPVADILGVLNAVVADVTYVLQARIDQLGSGEAAEAA